MNKPDILITSFSYTTATGLSNLVDDVINHDQVTHFLSQKDFTSKALWKEIKKTVRKIETDEGVLILMTLSKKNHIAKRIILFAGITIIVLIVQLRKS